ncbi:MAG: M64 family metallopeptidase [Ignavibacteria bacterium]
MKNKIILAAALLMGLLLNKISPAAVNVQTNADGTKYSAVLLNGTTVGKYDIVFVGDGFSSSASDQTSFNNAVNDAVNAMKNKIPYKNNMCAFNVWRVNVISLQTGIDHPKDTVFKNTELNCSFGDDVGTPERVIYTTTPERVTEAANFAPAQDGIYVLANDPQYGGAAGNIVFTSLNSSMGEVIVHELGHFTGKLADEYTCYFCDGRVEPAYSGPEPEQINITIQTNRNLVKWKNFIDASTPVPTTIDNPTGVVGLWVGGNYSPTAIYRPQLNCLMQTLNTELCTVCKDGLSKRLRPYCTVCERDPGSIFCILSKLKNRFAISRPLKFRIPECCFCPLDVFKRRNEIELTVNPQDFEIKVLDGGTNVQSEVRANGKGGTTVSFESEKGGVYFLSITPKTQLKEAVNVSFNLIQNGRQAVLF